MPSFSVHKSVVIRSDPETVYAMLRDFKRWPSWSPWLVTEPDCPLKFSPDGSSYEWDGRFVGSGRATISGESAPEHISIQLAFQRPWKSNAEVEFLLSTDLEGTRVTWTMKSAVPWFLFFMRSMMEALIGMDYDRGLSMLKDRLETGNVPSRLEFVGVQDSPAVRYVGIRRKCPLPEIGENMSGAYARLNEWFDAAGVKPNGEALALYHEFSVTKGMMTFTAAQPLPGTITVVDPDLATGTLPATRVYAIRHIGAYRHLGNAWSAGKMREQARLFRPNCTIPCHEVYENDCQRNPEEELRTTLRFPIR